MRTRKVILLLAAPLFFQFFLACVDSFDEQPLCDDSLVHYEFDEFTATNVDESDPENIHVTSGPVQNDDYAIRVTWKLKTLAQLNAIPESSTTLSIFPQAFACSPTYMLMDTITGFKIFTVSAFDDSHPADSDVSSMFRVDVENTSFTLSEFLNLYNQTVSTRRIEGIFDVSMHTPPTLNTTHQFKLQFTFKDGDIEEETTEVIEIVE